MATEELRNRSYSFVKTSSEEIFVVPNAKALELEVQRLRQRTPILIADVFYSSMSSEMEQAACDAGAHAMEKFTTEQLIAQYMKETFDKLYGKAWQCVCGKHFGSYVTFEPENFIYFRIGAMAFILFRAIGIQSQ